MNVSECMGIIWRTLAGGEEAKGIYFYGSFRSTQPTNDIEELQSLWSSLHGEVKTQVIGAEDDNVLVCDVRLGEWPGDNDWSKAVEDTLRLIVTAGGTLAWCGGEDCTWSTDVLDPTLMAGNVYAAYAESVGFLCNAPKLTDECVYLSDHELLSLHRLIHDGQPEND